MKKIFGALLIAVCMGMAIPAQAQIKFGVKGGVSLSKASLSNLPDNLKKDNFTGFFIGPMAEVDIPIVGLGLEAAALFSQRGVEIEDRKIKQNGIDIPVYLKYTVGLGSMFGIYFAAGPDFYFDFEKNKEMWDNENFELRTDKKRREIGINLGAGLKLVKHLQLGVNYNIPLGDSAEFISNSAEGGSYKTKTWQVSVAYIF